jgi:thiol-disulfide isomerase/thioredoxin
LNIETGRNMLNVDFSFQVLDQIGFLLMAGDSIEVDFRENFPYLKVTNREYNDIELNFEGYFFDRLKRNGNSAAGYLSSGYVVLQTLTGGKNIPSIDSLQHLAKDESKLYFHLLDSLIDRDYISQNYFDFYSNRRRFFDLSMESDKTDDTELLSKYHSRFDDNLLDFYFYQSALERFIYRYGKIKNVKMIRSSNGSNPDYRELFDLISMENDIPVLTHKAILNKTLVNVIRNFPSDDIKTYMAKYMEFTSDTLFHDFLVSKYNLDFETSHELKLTSLSSIASDFKSHLETQKGKLVYVDFWASWCAPCIRALPASKVLHKEFRENVAFVYLSIDENEEAWRKAVEKYELDDPSGSFLITNSKVSALLEDIQLESIPRYLLYDIEGNLVHKNAPGPDSEEIRILFDKYLGK